MNTLDAKLKTHLIGKKIKRISLFHINPNYISIESNALLILDAGIQIEFEDGLLSWVWNFADECFSYSLEESANTLFGEVNYFTVDSEQENVLKSLNGYEIKDLEVKSEYYYLLDENLEPTGEKLFDPKEITIKFEFGEYLQLSLASFELNENMQEIKNPVFNLSGEMIFSLNRKIEINE